MLNHPTGLFRETIIRPLEGAGPSNFYTTYNSLKCISSRTRGAGRPHVGLCPIFLVVHSTIYLPACVYDAGLTLMDYTDLKEVEDYKRSRKKYRC